MNSLLNYFDFNISKDVILAKYSTLMILMFTCEQVEQTDQFDGDERPDQSDSTDQRNCDNS